MTSTSEEAKGDESVALNEVDGGGLRRRKGASGSVGDVQDANQGDEMDELEEWEAQARAEADAKKSVATKSDKDLNDTSKAASKSEGRGEGQKQGGPERAVKQEVRSAGILWYVSTLVLPVLFSTGAFYAGKGFLESPEFSAFATQMA